VLRVVTLRSFNKLGGGIGRKMSKRELKQEALENALADVQVEEGGTLQFRRKKFMHSELHDFSTPDFPDNLIQPTFLANHPI
jgi:hypothetical protein